MGERSTDGSGRSGQPYTCPVCGHPIQAKEEYDSDGRQLWECPGSACRIHRLYPGEVDGSVDMAIGHSEADDTDAEPKDDDAYAVLDDDDPPRRIPNSAPLDMTADGERVYHLEMKNPDNLLDAEAATLAVSLRETAFAVEMYCLDRPAGDVIDDGVTIKSDIDALDALDEPDE